MRLDAGVPELHLLPPSVAELEGWPSLPFETLGRYLPPKLVHPRTTLGEMLEGRRPNERELEEDVGYLIRVHDRDRFHVFVRELAGRNGQVIDQRELAGECGVTHTTIARWLDALERLFVIVQACPAEEDFGKRLVRRRKVFFLDPGYIGETGRFESFVAAALLKRLWHRGEEARLSHWLTSTGSEVALVAGGHGFAVPVTGALTALEKWKRLSPRHAGSLITAGAEARRTGDVFVYPWFVL